jgi:hypothetical protein
MFIYSLIPPIMLSEASQAQEVKGCMFSLMWGTKTCKLSAHINTFIPTYIHTYTHTHTHTHTQIHTHTERENKIVLMGLSEGTRRGRRGKENVRE